MKKKICLKPQQVKVIIFFNYEGKKFHILETLTFTNNLTRKQFVIIGTMTQS